MLVDHSNVHNHIHKPRNKTVDLKINDCQCKTNANYDDTSVTERMMKCATGKARNLADFCLLYSFLPQKCHMKTLDMKSVSTYRKSVSYSHKDNFMIS